MSHTYRREPAAGQRGSVHVRVFLAIAMLVMLVACTREGPLVTPAWEPLPNSPLSPREFPAVVAADDKILVIGGSKAHPCPPNASCLAPREPVLRDGASFDLLTRKWSPLPDAPTGVINAQTARLNGSTFLMVNRSPWHGTRRTLLEFVHGTWKEHNVPGGYVSLAATDRELILYSETHENGYAPDLAVDPTTDETRELPRDPLEPSFDRYMTWTGEDLVLTAKDDVEQPNSDRPAVIRAAALNGTRWRKFPDSESIGSYPWLFVAGRLVLPALGSAEGGQVNGWGRSYNEGGILDPHTGEWSDLPNAPKVGRGDSFPGCAADATRTFCSGWALDVANSRWAPLPAIDGGAPSHAGSAIVRNELIVWGGTFFRERPALSDKGWSLNLA